MLCVSFRQAYRTQLHIVHCRCVTGVCISVNVCAFQSRLLQKEFAEGRQSTLHTRVKKGKNVWAKKFCCPILLRPYNIITSPWSGQQAERERERLLNVLYCRSLSSSLCSIIITIAYWYQSMCLFMHNFSDLRKSIAQKKILVFTNVVAKKRCMHYESQCWWWSNSCFLCKRPCVYALVKNRSRIRKAKGSQYIITARGIINVRDTVPSWTKSANVGLKFRGFSIGKWHSSFHAFYSNQRLIMWEGEFP